MWFFIRLTTDHTTKEALAEFLGGRYLISKEYSRRNKLHYHILWSTEKTKPQIQELIYNKFPDEPRGQPTLKVDLVAPTDDDLDQAGTYSVKDDDFIYSPFFEDRIANYVQNSFTKETVTQHVNRVIDEALEDDHPDFQKLAISIIQIKSDAGLEIYPAKIEAKVLSAMCRHDKNVAPQLVEKMKIFSLHYI